MSPTKLLSIDSERAQNSDSKVSADSLNWPKNEEPFVRKLSAHPLRTGRKSNKIGTKYNMM
jgi:hypothetical protein